MSQNNDSVTLRQGLMMKWQNATALLATTTVVTAGVTFGLKHALGNAAANIDFTPFTQGVPTIMLTFGYIGDRLAYGISRQRNTHLAPEMAHEKAQKMSTRGLVIGATLGALSIAGAMLHGIKTADKEEKQKKFEENIRMAAVPDTPSANTFVLKL